jgi:nucleoside-diphosphate-sugar epimerase
MKALITGSAGFIGSHVLDYLIDSDKYDAIIVLVHHKNKLIEKYHNNPKLVIAEFDLIDNNIDPALVADVDHVFHLAALASDRASLAELMTINAEGTKTFATKILELAPNMQLFFFMSSTAVYGMFLPEKTPIKEDYRKNPSSNYQKSKWAAEKYLWEIYKQKPFPLVVLRPPTMLGPRDHTTMAKVVQAIQNKKFPLVGNGKNILTMMDVRDFVKAIDLIIKNLQKAVGNAYNLYSFQVELKDYLHMIMMEINEDYKLPSYNYRVVYMLALMMEIKDKLFGTKSSKNRYRARKFGKTRLYDDTKIKTELGFIPDIKADQCIKDTIAWLYENKLIS